MIVPVFTKRYSGLSSTILTFETEMKHSCLRRISSRPSSPGEITTVSVWKLLGRFYIGLHREIYVTVSNRYRPIHKGMLMCKYILLLYCDTNKIIHNVQVADVTRREIMFVF